MAWVRCSGGGSLPRNYLFKNGILMTGIIPSTYTVSGWGSAGGTPSYTISGNELQLKLTGVSSGANIRSWFTDEIDVTNVNSITFTMTSVTGINTNLLRYGVTRTFANDYTMSGGGSSNQPGTYTIDTSTLTGNYRFVLCANAQTGGCQINISEIYMNV